MSTYNLRLQDGETEWVAYVRRVTHYAADAAILHPETVIKLGGAKGAQFIILAGEFVLPENEKLVIRSIFNRVTLVVRESGSVLFKWDPCKQWFPYGYYTMHNLSKCVDAGCSHWSHYRGLSLKARLTLRKYQEAFADTILGGMYFSPPALIPNGLEWYEKYAERTAYFQTANRTVQTYLVRHRDELPIGLWTAHEGNMWVMTHDETAEGPAVFVHVSSETARQFVVRPPTLYAWLKRKYPDLLLH